MPGFEKTDDYADRRQDIRRPVARTAELLPSPDKPGVPCAVLDESAGGLQIETAQALDLPEQLMIKFGDTSQLVRRCWSAGNRAGYQYIEIVPVQRRWVQDAPMTPEQIDLMKLKDFVQISLTLLDLATVAPDGAHPAEQINALLSEIPHARLQLADRDGSGQRVLQLFAIPQAVQGAISGEEKLLLTMPTDF